MSDERPRDLHMMKTPETRFSQLNNPLRTALLVLLAAAALLIQGCGYHRQDSSAQLPEWIRSVYVAPFENRSIELKFGAWITEDLRQEFLRDSKLTLTSKDDADVILTGTVESVYTTGLAYTRYDVAVERRVTGTVSVVLKDAKTGDVIWKTGDIERQEAFFVDKELMMTEGLKEAALKKMSRNLAEIIHHRITGVY